MILSRNLTLLSTSNVSHGSHPPPTAAACQIPNDTTAAKNVIDSVVNWMESYRWQERQKFNVHLAMEEAVVNAVKHGNQNDPGKSVRISYMVSVNLIRVAIEDDGRGFNPGDVPDPRHDDRLDVPSGRGLMLMRSFMSSVAFNEAGNQVVMELER